MTRPQGSSTSKTISSAPRSDVERRFLDPGFDTFSLSDFRPISAIPVPTLVIHGTADPMFPLEHGQALVDEIPGARLLRLDGAGHGVDRADWETIAQAILEHTAGRDADTT